MPTGFKGPLVHGPEISNKKYAYRKGTGMVPSAEWSVFIDDFVSDFIPTTAITNGPAANTPFGWSGAIIDTGETVAVNTTAAVGANGVLTISTGTASEGAAVYGFKALQLTANKRFWIETRVRTDDVTDNEIQFGLSSINAVTNPEDIWTTTATDLAVFGLLDGSAYPQLLADKSNTGTSVITQTVKPMVVDTWHTLAIGYDGVALRGYVDGDEVIRTTTTIPTGVALAPVFGGRAGDGASGNLIIFDYIRWVSER